MRLSRLASPAAVIAAMDSLAQKAQIPVESEALKSVVANASRYAPRGMLALNPAAFGSVYDSPFASVEITTDDSPAAVVDIVGPLVHHEDWWFDSYDGIKGRVRKALESSSKVVVLSIDSPGGLVAGCFDTVKELKEMAAEYGKPLWAYVDSQATSAANALCCACEKVFIPSTGVMGSIGVIDTLVDCTAADEQWGMKFVIVASGSRKADGNPHVSISEESVNATKAMVDTVAEQFFELVSNARGIPVEKIRNFNAGLFCGQQALDAGLADQIATLDEVVAMVAKSSEATTSTPTIAAEGEPMAAWKDQMRKAADDGDEEAKKALAAIDDKSDDKKDDDSKDKKEEAKKAESEDDKKEEAKKAESKEPDGDEKKDDEAKAIAASGLALAARVQELEKAEQQRKATVERATLMASRPDFAEATVAWLNSQPLATVRAACASSDKGGLPLGPGKGKQVTAAIAGLKANPAVPGTAPVDAPDLSLGMGARTNMSGRGEELDRIMGFSKPKDQIQMVGSTLVLNAMGPEDARAFQASRKAGV